uniref:Uncharacterized protein n=1 Tax=Pseudomonas phage HRDY3 TaxID=3236930 RepID=A0AB39CDM6_9VIRU
MKMDLSQHPTCKKYHDHVHETVTIALADLGEENMPYCNYVSPQFGQQGTEFEGGVYFELKHPDRVRKITLEIVMNTDGDFLVNWHLDDPDSLEEFTSRINNALRIANSGENLRRGTYVFRANLKDSRSFYLACRVSKALEKSGIYEEHERLNWTLGDPMMIGEYPVGSVRLSVKNEEHGDGMVIFMHSQAGGWHVMFVNDWMYAPEFEAVRLSMQKRFEKAVKDHKEEIEAI